MKKEFSKHWKESKQPRKQRKYLAKAPLHTRKKFVNVNLSKELREKHGKRTIGVKTGDLVKILRGKYKGKKGKIMKVYLKISKVIIDGIKVKKLDGSEVPVKIQPSNLQILGLNLEDGKRKVNKKNVKKEDPKTNKEKK